LETPWLKSRGTPRRINFKALNVEHQLVVLDAMLPRKDGWPVLPELRGAGKSIPVLILAARGATTDRVRGLEPGADVYLVKPYAFTELLARACALLRRCDQRQPDVPRVMNLRVT
jgi:two-component system copper resistance phosphate regulon response regulator CusR